MIRLDTLCFDVGGVCLTTGWDAGARLAAASQFVFDVAENDHEDTA